MDDMQVPRGETDEAQHAVSESASDPFRSTSRRFCTTCGSSVGDARFCSSCGQQQTETASARTESPSTPPSSVPGTLGLLGGVGFAAGAFLPWVKATAPFVGTITQSGMETGGLGLLFVVFGVVASLMAASSLQGGTSARRVGLMFVGVGAGLVVAFLWLAWFDSLDSAEEGFVTVSMGPGLVLLAASSLTVFVAGASLPDRED